MSGNSIFFNLFFLILLNVQGLAQEWSGFVASEGRLFAAAPAFEKQRQINASISFQPQFNYEWQAGDQTFTFVPFVRYDAGDPMRTHFDIRELFWRKVSYDWELKVGLAKVFWGVTESQHLVDIINQTDLVEDPDGEQKLGQPMVNFTYIQGWGTLDLFILPWFRERTFPGRSGRLRYPLPVHTEQTEYESDAGKRHIDLAIRWSYTIANFEIGIAHFYGASRDPRFRLGINGLGEAVLIPRYDLIHQSSLDLQAVLGGWLWKLEAIRRTGQGHTYFALTGGFDYTIGNFLSSGAYVGLLAEYLFDSRDFIFRAEEWFSPVVFQDDLFLGSRLSLNDLAGTHVLAGVILDRQSGASVVTLEGGRRVGNNIRLNVAMRAFVNVPESDFLFSLRNDDYFQVEGVYYF